MTETVGTELEEEVTIMEDCQERDPPPPIEPQCALSSRRSVSSCSRDRGLRRVPGGNGRIAAETTRTYDLRIVTMNPDGTGVTFLTNNFVREQHPAWSPDGTKIAFVSNAGGHNEIWVVNADGTGPKRLTVSATSDTFPAWSPDGLRIAFARNDRVTFRDDIWVMSAANGSGLRPPHATDAATSRSPPGPPTGRRSLS